MALTYHKAVLGPQRQDEIERRREDIAEAKHAIERGTWGFGGRLLVPAFEEDGGYTFAEVA